MADPRAPRCGAVARPDGSVAWRVWAPKAQRVDLVLTDGTRRRVCPMQREPHGVFAYAEDHVGEGMRYLYRFDDSRELPDPCSLWQPDGVHGPSAVVATDLFPWTDLAWQGVPRQDLVFYEVHVGTFTSEGTFTAIIPRLKTLRELGVTALELMPVGQFPGTRSWGYDGVFPYGVQSSYGGPHGLQQLVDACHAVGLGIFLDVVYNHLGPEGNYLAHFGPYFTKRYRTPWGPAFNYDDAGCDAVRDFVLDNVRLWLEAYHVDGLRLDAVHTIFDAGPRHILGAIAETAHEIGQRLGRQVHVIAESDLNDPRILLPPERGGYGLDAQWSDDFHHAVHAYLTGEHRGYYQDFGRAQDLVKVLEEPFLYAGQHSPYRGRKHGAPAGDLSGDRFVVHLQNHDQIGNRARGDRLDTLLPPPARRLAACLMLLAPHLPLLFMGQEYGEDNPFLFFCSFGEEKLIDSVREGRREEFAAFGWQGEVPDPQAEATFAASHLSWSWPEGTPRAGLRRLYADLLAARRAWPALHDFRQRRARLVPEGIGRILDLVRGAGSQGQVRILFNLLNEPRPLPPITDASMRLLFSSEAPRYAGARGEARGEARANQLLPHECLAWGPAGWRTFAEVSAA